jgi:glycosyltransferase EpsD
LSKIKMTKKVLFTASIAKHILRFHLPYLRWFQEQGFETHVACSGEECIPHTDVKHQIAFVRSPFHLGHKEAYRELKALLNREEYKIVHCHTPMASVVTRLAAKMSRNNGTKVLYTAHGFHFYKGSPTYNWLTYYPVELALARFADAIITINEEDFQAIKSKESKTTKVFKIPGVGVDKKRFFPVDKEEKISLRKKNGFAEEDFILVYAAEFILRKNHFFIINATRKLAEEIPSIKILFAGRGALKEVLEQQVKALGLDGIINFLGFREDIDEVFKLSDVGISSSKQEGLGLNLVEEMMCGLPIVASEDRGHKEIVDLGINGFLFPQGDLDEFILSIKKLYENKDLRISMGQKALEKAKKFELSNSLKEMEKIYKQFLR